MLSQSAIKAAWAPPCRGPWVEIGLHGAGRVTVRKAAYEATKALDACLRAWNYRTRYADTGAYVCRATVSGSGTSLHAYGVAIDINWQCLTGDTLVVTPDGPVRIDELAGTTARLLTRDPYAGGQSRWVDAPVRAFGVAPVKRVTLTRRGIKKTVRATGNHRWFAYENPNQSLSLTRVAERTTDELAPGDVLLGCLTPPTAFRTTVSPVGVMAGLVFGDGSRQRNRDTVLDLFGDNMEMLRYFAEPRLSPLTTPNGVTGVRVSGLPGYFKDAPPRGESAAYLLGWLAGYFSADGSVSKNGTASITASKREHLELFSAIATRVGIACNTISTFKREGYGGTSERHSLTLVASTVPEHFFIRSVHHERFTQAESRKGRFSWTVESIEDDGEEAEVFCPTVEGTGAFALDGWLLTGNSNPYSRRLVTDMPRAMVNAICAIRTNNGKQVWNWGGFWSGNKDAMHWEVVCSPRDLATGINWATVPGGGAGIPSIPPPVSQPKPLPPLVPGVPPDALPRDPQEDDEMETPLLIQHDNSNPARNGHARYRDGWGRLWDLDGNAFNVLLHVFKVKHVVVNKDGWRFWEQISQDGNALPRRW